MPPGGLPEPPPLPKEIREGPPPPPTNLPDPAELREQLRLLDEFLQLSPDQLRRMRQTIEVIERMSEDDRTRMRERLQQMRTTSPETDRQMRQLIQWVPAPLQREASQFWLSLSEKQRTGLWEEWSALPEDEQKQAAVSAVEVFKEKREAQFRSMREVPAGD